MTSRRDLLDDIVDDFERDIGVQGPLIEMRRDERGVFVACDLGVEPIAWDVYNVAPDGHCTFIGRQFVDPLR